MEDIKPISTASLSKPKQRPSSNTMLQQYMQLLPKPCMASATSFLLEER